MEPSPASSPLAPDKTATEIVSKIRVIDRELRYVAPSPGRVEAAAKLLVEAAHTTVKEPSRSSRASAATYV
ncbi:hypothetical protein RJ55_07463 [Drechmeria coniospora]|nr:hypothetical protein RJ55_07463 [Drechmeria coniospora]